MRSGHRFDVLVTVELAGHLRHLCLADPGSIGKKRESRHGLDLKLSCVGRLKKSTPGISEISRIGIGIGVLSLVPACLADEPERGVPSGARQVSPIADEIVINEVEPNAQHHVRVAYNGLNDWRAIWTSDRQGDQRVLSTRSFDGTVPLEGERLVKLVAAEPHHGEVACEGSDWVLAWHEGVYRDLWLGTIDDTGLVGERLVRDATVDRYIDNSDVAVSPSGEILAVWYEVNEDETRWRYLHHRYTADLAPIGDVEELAIGAYPYEGSPPTVEPLGEADFVIAFSQSAYAGGGSVYLARVHATGEVGVQLIHEVEGRKPSRPSIGVGDDNQIAVVWRSQAHSGVMISQHVVVDNGVVGEVQRLVGVESDRPAISAVGDYYAIAWEEYGTGESDVYVQMFSLADGLEASNHFRANQYRPGDQNRPDVALTQGTGGVIQGTVVFESDGRDTEDRAAVARGFSF